jgi:hypothetical protein
MFAAGFKPKCERELFMSFYETSSLMGFFGHN